MVISQVNDHNTAARVGRQLQPEFHRPVPVGQRGRQFLRRRRRPPKTTRIAVTSSHAVARKRADKTGITDGMARRNPQGISEFPRIEPAAVHKTQVVLIHARINQCCVRIIDLIEKPKPYCVTACERREQILGAHRRRNHSPDGHDHKHEKRATIERSHCYLLNSIISETVFNTSMHDPPNSEGLDISRSLIRASLRRRQALRNRGSLQRHRCSCQRGTRPVPETGMHTVCYSASRTSGELRCRCVCSRWTCRST